MVEDFLRPFLPPQRNSPNTERYTGEMSVSNRDEIFLYLSKNIIILSYKIFYLVLIEFLRDANIAITCISAQILFLYDNISSWLKTNILSAYCFECYIYIFLHIYILLLIYENIPHLDFEDWYFFDLYLLVRLTDFIAALRCFIALFLLEGTIALYYIIKILYVLITQIRLILPVINGAISQRLRWGLLSIYALCMSRAIIVPIPKARVNVINRTRWTARWLSFGA